MPISIVLTGSVFLVGGNKGFLFQAEWKNFLEYSNTVIFRLAKQDLKYSARSSVIENNSTRGT